MSLTYLPALDLKELRKLLGVKYCPNCKVRDYHDRVTRRPLVREELHEAVQEARELFATGSSMAAIERVLASAGGLTMAHVYGVCPLLKIPHFSIDAFVPERLHERCV